MADGEGGNEIKVEISPSQLTPQAPPETGASEAAAGNNGASASPKSPAPQGILSGQKVPLSKAVVKFPILTGSRAIADILDYPRFEFTEAEADALAAAIAELGLEFTPLVNILLLAGGILTGKTMGYVMWRKAGKPALNPDGTRMARVEAPRAAQPADGPAAMSAAWEEAPKESAPAAEQEPDTDPDE